MKQVLLTFIVASITAGWSAAASRSSAGKDVTAASFQNFLREHRGGALLSAEPLDQESLDALALDGGPEANILAAAVLDPQFLDSNRDNLARLLGSALPNVEARAKNLASRAQADSGFAARLAEKRAQVAPRAGADLSNALRTAGRAMDGRGGSSTEESASVLARADQALHPSGLRPTASRGEDTELRKAFNADFLPEKHAELMRTLEERVGGPIPFQVSETPVFLEKTLLDEMVRAGSDIARQLITPEYLKASAKAVPPEFRNPREAPHPLFVQMDFGLIRDASGRLRPKLVELQGFPSLYAYAATLAQTHLDVHHLRDKAGYLLGGLDEAGFQRMIRRAIVGRHAPRNVILMEIDPLHQGTRPDFLATEKLTGVKTVDVMDVEKVGRRLYYRDDRGRRVRIRRVYYRVLPEEMAAKKIRPAFHFSDDLDVEWAGDPSWFFRMSKFSLPFIKHETVPETRFLSDSTADLQGFVLKPLFFAGGEGVKIHPTQADVDAIPQDRRSGYILQRRVDFTPFIDTPEGPTKAEIRIMYVWLDKLVPVISYIRMGRGSIMAVGANRQPWAGSAASLYRKP